VTVTRPVLRYHGGKWRLAPWVIEHFPYHKVYVEPFGGAASVLMQKERAYAEVYNDLDGEIVNVFRVLRKPEQAERLAYLLAFTPYAREEFVLSYEPSDEPIEQARRTIVRSYMGYSSDAATRTVKTGFKSDATGDRRRHFAKDFEEYARPMKTGFRTGSMKPNRHPSRDFVEFAGQHVTNLTWNGGEWLKQGGAVMIFCERLSGVVIESIDALRVINKYDSPRTLFYCDPPYLHSTRDKSCAGRAYRHEMTDEDHRVLLDLLINCKGMVVLSGYRNDLYDYVLCGLYKWTGYERAAKGQAGKGNGSKNTVECLWISPNAEKMLNPKLALYEGN